MVVVLILAFGVLAFSAELRIIDHKKGDEYGQQFGDACEGLGDINGDGYGDFLVTEFRDRKLHLYLGGPHPFDSLPAITWSNHGAPSLLRSFSPVCVGDVDCDGVNDFISVFSPDDTVKLFLGLETLDPDDSKVIFIDTSFSWSYRVFGGGDNNNDGDPDFWLFAERPLVGDTIRGFSGCTQLDTIPDFKIVRSLLPDNKYASIGYELCSTCDLNGDSIPEIIFGQPTGYDAYPGRVCIVWGDEMLSMTPDLVFYAPYPHGGNMHFGYDMACLGDISGDGIDDIWIGQGGRNYIYFGGRPFDTIPDIGLDWSYVSGDYIDNVGDINNDGYNDIMLTMDDYLFSYVSFIYCYPGMDTLVDIAWSDNSYYNAILDGPLCCLGLDHSWVGDVDGDDIDDILIAPSETDVDHLDHGWIILQAGWEDPVSVDDDTQQNPSKYSLEQNYPNPFNSGTTIEFTLPRAGYTEIRIFNLLGELVAVPLAQSLTAGEHQIIWDGRDESGNITATGIYFYQVESGEFNQTKKMVLLK